MTYALAGPPAYLDLLSGLALCVILGANNLSTCLGTSVGARTLSYPQALMLASIGLMAGVLLEGDKLSGALTSGIVSSTTAQFTLPVALSSFVLMSFLTYWKLPISLSQVAIGAAIGTAFAQGIRIDWAFTLLVASSWLLTPLGGFMIAAALSLITRNIAKKVRRILTLNALYAYLALFSGVYSSYTLGANTVGLIIGVVAIPQTYHLLASLAFGITTIVGMLTFSRRTTLSVAENIVGLNPSASFAAQAGGAVTVHGFTEFGIPVSVSQGVLGGIFGAAFTRNIVVRNRRLTKEILFGWTLAPCLGTVFGFLLGIVL